MCLNQLHNRFNQYAVRRSTGFKRWHLDCIWPWGRGWGHYFPPPTVSALLVLQFVYQTFLRHHARFLQENKIIKLFLTHRNTHENTQNTLRQKNPNHNRTHTHTRSSHHRFTAITVAYQTGETPWLMATEVCALPKGRQMCPCVRVCKWERRSRFSNCFLR